MGCAGHPIVKTPNLDGLARKGTRFSAAYTPSPICVPARASIATGRYVHEHRCWDNAIAYDGRTPSWGHRLQQAGIRVESIGKLHYRKERSEEHTSELQSLMRISYAVFCLKKKRNKPTTIIKIAKPNNNSMKSL